jgi:hypothetical protein
MTRPTPAKLWLILALAAATPILSACGPVIGAGAAVIADEAAEEDGDDGLF